ncbi:MinD/ParA family ATP-binding protein [Tsukamurella strandjordii]|uniref:MinD-like ATPase involved in chromosome partitioning or flagellar assembly n=1 Tax=Tsukamurella strandjordii TaxID=147577 RepID=A0AA90SPQ2_9ACTN|nr:hypothetical protein [Tsukamurella strandjordii]MDP0397131.1 hypothetical protein [Tsukamurella strandjordii]
MSDGATNVHLPFAEQNKTEGAPASPTPQPVAGALATNATSRPVVNPGATNAEPASADSAPATGEWEEPDLPGVEDADEAGPVPTAAPADPTAAVAASVATDDERPTIEQPVIVDEPATDTADKPEAAPEKPVDEPVAEAPTPTPQPQAAQPVQQASPQAAQTVPVPAQQPQQQWQQAQPGQQHFGQPHTGQFQQPQFGGQPPTGQFQAPVQGRPPSPLPFGQAAPGQGAQPQQQHAGMPMRPMGESVSAPMSTASSSFQQHIRMSESAVRVTGWRAWLKRMGIDVGPSTSEQEHAELVHRIRVPKNKFHVTSVFADSAGGTLLVGVLGQILERTRADNVVALDLDPDGGDLDQVTAWHQGGSTARTLIQQSDLSDRNQVDKHLAVTPTNLHVLPTPWRFNGRDVTDYDDVLDLYSIFRPHYSLALVDAGRGLQTVTGTGVLEISSALILPASATTRGVRKVAATIDWLRHHGWHGLLANTIVVINHTKKRGSVTVEQFDELFRAGQKLRVHEIPYDPHLDADMPIDLDLLKPRTVRAFELLAADLADTFNSGYEPPAATKLAELQVRSHEGR